jgi:hypothetical protein
MAGTAMSFFKEANMDTLDGVWTREEKVGNDDAPFPATDGLGGTSFTGVDMLENDDDGAPAGDL